MMIIKDLSLSPTYDYKRHSFLRLENSGITNKLYEDT